MNTTTRYVRHGRVALAATALLVAQGVAADQTAAATANLSQRTVRFADLNLSDPSDVSQLYKRLLQAARRVCGTHTVPLALNPPQKRECRTDAVARAVRTLDQPLLTAHHEAQQGRVKTANKRYANASEASTDKS